MRSPEHGDEGQPIHRFDRFCLNPLERRLTFNEVPIAIPPKQLDALLTLVANAGRLMGKEELHRHLWPDTFVEDVTLARIISDLRRILAQHSPSTYIETVPKHGYRFVAPVRSSAFEGSGPKLTREPDEESDARQIVMRAWYTIRLWSPDVVTEALRYARRAIATNPSYADAHAVLAYIYLYAGFGFLPGRDAFPRARAAAANALRLDALCAPAHAVSGMLKIVFDRDLAAAEQCCRTAIELAPDQMPGHFAYSHLLLIQGRFREALDEALSAMEADPLSCSVAWHVAGILYYSGCDEEAVTQLLKFEYLDPDFLPAHQLLAVLYARLNRREDAFSEAAKAIELSGHNSRGKATLGIVSALMGMHSEARDILRDLQENRGIPGFRWSYARAIIHCYLGEHDNALECLSQACEDTDGAVMYLRYDPHFVELRSDERFTKIVTRMGF